MVTVVLNRTAQCITDPAADPALLKGFRDDTLSPSADHTRSKMLDDDHRLSFGRNEICDGNGGLNDADATCCPMPSEFRQILLRIHQRRH
jgi:hypothetical protein